MGIDAVPGAGGDAYALAQRLRATRSAWDNAIRNGESTGGLPVVREAFRALQDTWFTEVGAHATVLEQLSESTDIDERTEKPLPGTPGGQ